MMLGKSEVFYLLLNWWTCCSSATTLSESVVKPCASPTVPLSDLAQVQKILLDKDTQTLYRTILLYFGCFGSLFSGNDSGTVWLVRKSFDPNPRGGRWADECHMLFFADFEWSCNFCAGVGSFKPYRPTNDHGTMTPFAPCASHDWSGYIDTCGSTFKYCKSKERETVKHHNTS